MLVWFQDTGVMNQVNNEIFRPVTVFLPSDGVMASLPQEQKDFLFHQHNRPQLVEYLKFHVLQNQKVKTGIFDSMFFNEKHNTKCKLQI